MRRVYVSGPITKGEHTSNVRQAIEASDRLAMFGYAVFCPHMNWQWHFLFPHDYEFWMDQDFAWVEMCDAVLRLDGESPGADREVAFANEHGIPVFTTVDELDQHFAEHDLRMDQWRKVSMYMAGRSAA